MYTDDNITYIYLITFLKMSELIHSYNKNKIIRLKV